MSSLTTPAAAAERVSLELVLAIDVSLSVNDIEYGLTIVNNEEGLTPYYQHNVISGANSFVISVQDFSDFGQAFRRKLIRELNAKIAQGAVPLDVALLRQ